MDDQRKELRKLIAQLRPVQGVRSTTREYRNLDEQNDARTVLEAAGLQFTNLRHRGEGRDPPDCEVEIDGVRCGIELTEFVHRRTLEKSIKAHKADSRYRYYHEWTREGFLEQLREEIAKKDQPRDLKDGPWQRYFLIFWTGEMHLGIEELTEFLDGAVFECELITDALMGLDYHSGRGYPAVRIPVVRKLAVIR
jgi:hypothetical protein